MPVGAPPIARTTKTYIGVTLHARMTICARMTYTGVPKIATHVALQLWHEDLTMIYIILVAGTFAET